MEIIHAVQITQTLPISFLRFLFLVNILAVILQTMRLIYNNHPYIEKRTLKQDAVCFLVLISNVVAIWYCIYG
jgi:hypothetical protein